MSESNGRTGMIRENWAAELTDSALELAARHGVRGMSVDQELELWHTLRRAASKRSDCRDNSTSCQDQLAARLSDEVYGAILHRGFEGSFLDLRLDLWQTLRAGVNRVAASA